MTCVSMLLVCRAVLHPGCSLRSLASVAVTCHEAGDWSRCGGCDGVTNTICHEARSGGDVRCRRAGAGLSAGHCCPPVTLHTAHCAPALSHITAGRLQTVCSN